MAASRTRLTAYYEYPGGWASDRVRLPARAPPVRGAGGQWATASSPGRPPGPSSFVGLLFIMCWTSMASPTLFAVVGDALPTGRRSGRVLGPGDSAPAADPRGSGAGRGADRGGGGPGGRARGPHRLRVTLALVTLAVVRRMRLDRPTAPPPGDIRAVWRSLPAPLRRLLVSDICIRACDGMVDVFLVLYAVNVVCISAPAFGGLIGVQTATVILCLRLAAHLADRVGRKPFVIAHVRRFRELPARGHCRALARWARRGVRGGRPARDRRAGAQVAHSGSRAP